MSLTERFAAAAFRRGELLTSERTTCCRLFSGGAEGLEGLYVDRLGPAAIVNIYEGTEADRANVRELAGAMLTAWSRHGITSVYTKRFPRDRSSLTATGELLTDPSPAAGEALPESFEVLENGLTLLVRPYDGFSTGLFLDQRANRTWLRGELSVMLTERPRGVEAMRVCNLFAYTGAFGLFAAAAAHDRDAAGSVVTTNADVSGRYLTWAAANYKASGIDPSLHHFPRLDARSLIALAQRRSWLFAMIVIDPPTFGSGDKKKGIRPWRAERDYAPLVGDAAGLLEPGGVLLCSTNTARLCEPGRLERVVAGGLGARPSGASMRGPAGTYDLLELPPTEADVALERGRFAAIAIKKRG